MPYLHDSPRTYNVAHISSYTAITLMVTLARLCHEHVSTATSNDRKKSGFWDRHYSLVKSINDYTAIIRMHLTAKAVREDPTAFTLHINFCAVHILLHDAATARVKEQELQNLVAADSQKCSVAAAFKIANAIRIAWPAHRSEVRYICIARLSYLAPSLFY